MDIQVGEYVRTKYGEIGKIWGDEGNRVATEDNSIYFKDEIVKHSFNIIDLIEVGDYVNGYKVLKVLDGYVYIDRENANKKAITFCDYQIKTIVTKEQLKAMEYEV